MREVNIKWKDIIYVLEMNEAALKMSHRRAADIAELGENPVIKRAKFETPINLRVKQLAKDNLIRDFGAKLREEFPDKLIPCPTTIHKILNIEGFKMIKLLKKTLIWPRNQLKRLRFYKELAEYGPAFWDTVIWSDETTVR